MSRRIRSRDSERREACTIFFDAGCGTGLLGPLVRNFNETLIGVDLSEKMAAVYERKKYDELPCWGH